MCQMLCADINYDVHVHGHRDMMLRCAIWIGTAYFLFVFAHAVRPELGVGAIFELEEYHDFSGIFYNAFRDNRLITSHNISFFINATSFRHNASVLYTLNHLCEFVKGRDFRALLVVGKEQSLQAISQVAQPLGIPILGYTTDTAIDRHVHAHNPLMLLLKPSKIDQANAFIQFFEANFWFDIILIVQDLFVSDGFYYQITSNSTDKKWSVVSKILPEKIELDKLHQITTSLLSSEPKIVVIHANFSLVERIFKFVLKNEKVRSLNHAWFLTETSFTRDPRLLDVFPTGALAIVPNYAVNIEDVILDGTNFIIKSVINNPHRRYANRDCQSDSLKLYSYVGQSVFKNKWRWDWLENDFMQQYLRKIKIAGQACCTLCNQTLEYQSSGKKDLLLDIGVGVLPGSAVESIVKQLNFRLYQKCQSHKVSTTDNAIKRLIHGELDAYLGDYFILDYARAKLDPDCKLRLLTQTFGEDGYGIGLPKGSPLKAPLSKQIQQYHESGYIEDLIDVHFADSRCYKQRIKQEDSRLEVQHHAGSFVMLCVGIIVGLGILMLEHAVFKWLVPRFRLSPGQSIWKSVHLMFFSQRLHRTITSAELVPTHEIYREMKGIMKNKDFIKLFQKNTIKTNKMADAAKRKRLNRNFFDIIEKAKWMKEMQDNNLFGSDSTPSSPTPMIKEVSLRDITQAVDLAELRRQNYENRHVDLNFMMPTRSTNRLDRLPSRQTSDSENACDTGVYTAGDGEEVDSSESRALFDELQTDLSTDALITEAAHNPVVDDINGETATPNTCSEMPCEPHSYDLCLFERLPNKFSDNNGSKHSLSSTCLAHQHQQAHPKTPNGDVKHKRKGIQFMLETETLDSNFVPMGCYNNESDRGHLVDFRGSRRLSIPDSKPKESRTFHPRKRQTIHGNRRGRGQSGIDVDKLSKEELLLMWKSSEVDLNEKLKAAQRDKHRLQTKLKALKLNKSTAV